MKPDIINIDDIIIFDILTKDNIEKIVETNKPGYDSVNSYSTYLIIFKDIDLVKFIGELRKLNIVREANYTSDKITSD